MDLMQPRGMIDIFHPPTATLLIMFVHPNVDDSHDSCDRLKACKKSMSLGLTFGHVYFFWPEMDTVGHG